MLGTLTPSQLDVFEYSGVVVVSAESSISTETLTKVAELGRFIYVCAAAQDSITAWATSTRVPTVSYPPSQTDVDALLAQIRRGDTGATNSEDQYRRVVIGGDAAARIASNMVARKIVVTSPKRWGGENNDCGEPCDALCTVWVQHISYRCRWEWRHNVLSHQTEWEYRSSVIQLLRRSAAMQPSHLPSNVMMAAAGASSMLLHHAWFTDSESSTRPPSSE